MDKIDIEKLSTDFVNAPSDIEILAEKINEIIDEMNKCKCGDSMCSECN